MRIMSVNLSYKLNDLGATSDDGQEFGLAHGDYSLVEIEACIESNTSIDLGNLVAQEAANRLVRTIGQMTGAPGTGAGLSFNDGRPKKTKLNWALSIGDDLQIWVRNGSPTDWTTGAFISVIGDMWVKDSI